MARRRRSSVDVNNITSALPDEALLEMFEPPTPLPDPRHLLSPIDNFLPSLPLPFDRRLFDYEMTRPASNTLRPNLMAPFNPQSSDLQRTAVCIRRAQRREVLHALNRVRRGRGGARKFRSEIKC